MGWLGAVWHDSWVIGVERCFSEAELVGII